MKEVEKHTNKYLGIAHLRKQTRFIHPGKELAFPNAGAVCLKWRQQKRGLEGMRPKI